MEKLRFNLQLFTAYPDADNVQVTTQTALGKDMSPTMKTFYDTSLLENARDAMVFTQFGKRQPIHGQSVEWRKFNTFANALTPLTEGVIPTGENFGMTKITGSVEQYGDYVTVSDRLELEAYDDIIYGATEEMGAAEGETYDILTRNALLGGTFVAYAGAATSIATITVSTTVTPTDFNKVATYLKKNKAPKIDGFYVALIHPSVAYDLRQSAEWIDYHKYVNVEPIYKGEIGELHGIRFVESNLCKIYDGTDADTTTGDGSCLYVTFVLGKDAFGIVDPEGEGMEMIIKSRSEIGGPLNQFSTIGYKFCHAAVILYQERMYKLYSGSSMGADDTPN